jgi:hypothetical protein
LSYQIKDSKLLNNRLGYCIPILIGIFVILLNNQWLALFQLPNAPAGDSLVYMTESFNDYWLIRQWALDELIKKYFVVGNQINSPLLNLVTAISYLLFGLSPANAYLTIEILYLIWIATVIYLAFNIFNDKQFSIACGILAALLPSAGGHAIRHFMLDFSAAGPFMLATAFLIKSNLLHERRYVILYAILASITILFRTTTLMYFVSHIGIVLYFSLLQKKWPNFKNIAIAVLIVCLMCGIFILPNIGRITDYYTYWAGQAKLTQQASFIDNFIFYMRQLNSFHMLRPGFAVYLVITLAAVLVLIKRELSQKAVNSNWKIYSPLIISLIIIVLPTITLSLYSSRAATVDFIFIGAYLLIPTYLWRVIYPNSRYFWIPVIILSFALLRTEVKLLVQGELVDYREREVLKLILSDAELRGLNTVILGNTSIHQHNSLSYQYWTLANYFPRWTNRVKLASIGRTTSAEELASMNINADYVITLKNYNADWHPNNIVAPEANKILQDKFFMKPLPVKFELPDGAFVEILAKQTSISFPKPFSDNWHENNVKVEIRNPEKKLIRLRITAEVMNLNTNKDFSKIIISSNLEKRPIEFEVNGIYINHIFELPQNFFSNDGIGLISISSSTADIPSRLTKSKDNRNLAFRNLKFSLEN